MKNTTETRPTREERETEAARQALADWRASDEYRQREREGWPEEDLTDTDETEVTTCDWCGQPVEADSRDQVAIGSCEHDLICPACWARWIESTEALRSRIKSQPAEPAKPRGAKR